MLLRSQIVISKNYLEFISEQKEYFLENGWVEEDNGVYLKENGTANIKAFVESIR